MVALAAAARRPAAVRSLVLIEPSALRIAEQVPVVKAALERNRAMFADGAPFRGMSAQDYLRAGAELGFPVPEFIERRLAACHTNCDGRARAWSRCRVRITSRTGTDRASSMLC